MDTLARNAERYFGDRGKTWLGKLASILDQLAARWQLEIEPHFPRLSVNYVAPATRADGTRCVLKVGVVSQGLRAEIAALGCWRGRGAVRLLESDPERGAMLLERLEPGTDIAAIAAEDDDTATRIAAGIMRQLWRSPQEQGDLRDLASLFGDLLDDAAPTDALFERGKAVARELLDSTDAPVVLHGDLHHFNILAARRAPWLAIDPKGLLGEAGYDLAAFLHDPHRLPLPALARRLDLFCEELGLGRSRARDWCFAEAMLNARWCQREDPEWLPDRVEWAELLLQL